MSYHPPDCKCMGDWCRENQTSGYTPNARPARMAETDFLRLMIKATNPFNRIEARESDLRRTLKRR